MGRLINQDNKIGDIYCGDIFIVKAKDIIDNDFKPKSENTTKYFITLGYNIHDDQYAGVLINTKSYNDKYSIEIKKDNYTPLLKHNSFIKCDNIFLLPSYTIHNTKKSSLTKEDEKNVIDNIIKYANDDSITYYKNNMFSKILHIYDIRYTQNLFEKNILSFKEFINLIYN